MMDVLVRSYRDEDAEPLAGVLFDAVHGTAREFYNKDQVVAWAPEVPGVKALHRRLNDGRSVLWRSRATSHCRIRRL